MMRQNHCYGYARTGYCPAEPKRILVMRDGKLVSDEVEVTADV